MLEKVYVLTKESVWNGERKEQVLVFDTQESAQRKMFSIAQEFDDIHKEVKLVEAFRGSSYIVREAPDDPVRNHIALMIYERTVVHDKNVRKEDFPVASISREDLEWKGYKAQHLNDDTMDVIASKMASYLLDDIGYWDALEASADWHGVPRKEDRL